MLKGFNDGCGNVWRCFPKQLYLAEVTYKLSQQVTLSLAKYLVYRVYHGWSGFKLNVIIKKTYTNKYFSIYI